MNAAVNYNDFRKANHGLFGLQALLHNFQNIFFLYFCMIKILGHLLLSKVKSGF